MTYVLTPERLAEYAKRFDFRTQFVKAARQILADFGVEAVGPGEGVRNVPRYYTTVDFQRGAAVPTRKTPVILGDRRYREYSQFLGVLSIFNTVPMEEDEKTGGQYLSEDHARTLDELCAKEHAIFMEHLEPFTAELLPYIDVQELILIEPDERPINEREVNAAFMRWRVKFEMRTDAGGAWGPST
jgi:hypothetical protein